MPAFIGLCFLGLSSVFKELHFVGIGIFGSLTTLGIFREIVALELPTHESSSHKMIHRAVNYVNHAPIHGKIYYMHPMVAYYNGLGTKDQHERYIQRFIHLKKTLLHSSSLATSCSGIQSLVPQNKACRLRNCKNIRS